MHVRAWELAVLLVVSAATPVWVSAQPHVRLDLPGAGPAADMAASPDRLLLAVAGPSTTRVYNSSGYPIRDIDTGVPPARLAFMPDGKRLAIADINGRLSMVDPYSGRLLWWQATGERPNSLHATADGNYLVYSNPHAYGLVTPDGNWVADRWMSDGIVSSAISARGDRLALVYASGYFACVVVDVATGNGPYGLERWAADFARQAAFSKDGKTVYLVSNGGSATKWTLASGTTELLHPGDGADPTTNLALGYGGGYLIYGTGRILNFLQTEWVEEAQIAQQGADGDIVAVVPDFAAGLCRTVAAVGATPTWFDPYREGQRFVAFETPIRAMAWRRTSLELLVASEGATAQVDGSTGRTIRRFALSRPATAVTGSNDGLLHAIGTDDGKILVSRWSDGAVVRRFQATESGAVLGLAFGPAGDWLAAITTDRTTRIWDLGTGSLRFALPTNPAPLTALSGAQGSPMIATGDADGLVRLYYIGDRTAPLRQTLAAKPSPITSVGLTYDRGQVAVAYGSSVDVHETSTGALRWVLPINWEVWAVANVRANPSGYLWAVSGPRRLQLIEGGSGGSGLTVWSAPDAAPGPAPLAVHPNFHSLAQASSGSLRTFANPWYRFTFLSRLDLESYGVTGGESIAGSLSRQGGFDGLVVTLQSDQPDLVAPAVVGVGRTASQASFVVTTRPVTSAKAVRLTARAGPIEITKVVHILPPYVAEIELPATITGGTQATGAVVLDGPAPTYGTSVSLASTSPVAWVPKSLVVPGGQRRAEFTITTTRPAWPTQAVLTATTKHVFRRGVVRVNP